MDEALREVLAASIGQIAAALRASGDARANTAKAAREGAARTGGGHAAAVACAGGRAARAERLLTARG